MSEEASVYVVNGNGDMQTADEFMVGRGIEKEVQGIGDVVKGTVEGVEIEKASDQVGDENSQINFVAPRVSFDNLLFFMDVNSWHRRCVNIKANLVGGIGWEILDGDKVIYDASITGSEAPKHPVIDFLLKPNADSLATFDGILERVLIDYYALGNGYIEVVRNTKGTITEIYHVRGTTMVRSGDLKKFYQRKGSKEVWFYPFGKSPRGSKRNEMIHFYQYDPKSDVYGVPDWFGALGHMGLDRAMIEYNINLFSNSMMATLAIVVKGGRLSSAGRDAVKSFIRDRMVGTANAGRVLLLEDENDRIQIDFQKLNVEVKDLMIVEAQRYFRDAVVSANGVPPRLLGISTPGQLGGGNEVVGQMAMFRETVLKPGKRNIERIVNHIFDDIAKTESCSCLRLRMKDLDLRVDYGIE